MEFQEIYQNLRRIRGFPLGKCKVNAGRDHGEFDWEIQGNQLNMWDTTQPKLSHVNSFIIIYSESAKGVKTQKTKHGDLLWYNKTVPYIINDHGKSN